MQKYDPKSKDERLKWLRVMISNIKANIEDAYHGLGRTCLQRYLNEFYHRFNRHQSKKPISTTCWYIAYGHPTRR